MISKTFLMPQVHVFVSKQDVQKQEQTIKFSGSHHWAFWTLRLRFPHPYFTGERTG